MLTLVPRRRTKRSPQFQVSPAPVEGGTSLPGFARLRRLVRQLSLLGLLHAPYCGRVLSSLADSRYGDVQKYVCQRTKLCGRQSPCQFLQLRFSMTKPKGQLSGCVRFVKLFSRWTE